jgi:prevent-host-death family protein
MKEISISEFRQQCLNLVDKVPPDGIVITRRGQPIAKLVPYHRNSCLDLIGSVPGIIKDPSDDLFSTGERWDAES